MREYPIPRARVNTKLLRGERSSELLTNKNIFVDCKDFEFKILSNTASYILYR